MTRNLHFPNVAGLGSGIFFLGYLVLEIPGAILVERWSARKWIARIMISGLFAALTGFIHTAPEFYGARFFTSPVWLLPRHPGLCSVTVRRRPRQSRRLLHGWHPILGNHRKRPFPDCSQVHWLWESKAGAGCFCREGAPAIVLGIINDLHQTP